MEGESQEASPKASNNNGTLFYKNRPGDGHKERSNPLNQRNPTIKWLTSTVRTAFEDSEVEIEKLEKAVLVEIEKIKAESGDPQ